MKKSRLDRPHIKRLIAYAIANGHSQREIGRSFGVSQPTIHRFSKRSDICALVRAEEEKFVRQTEVILQKIQHDPQFLAEFQRSVERELLNFKKLQQNTLYQSE